MSNTEIPAIDGFVLMRFKKEALAGRGLPDIDYPIPTELLFEAMGGAGMLENKQLLACMQQYTAHGEVKDWQDYLPAMHALTKNISPPGEPYEIEVIADRWSIVCGEVDLDGPVVAYCRNEEILAVACRNPDGRLRMMSYQPLDQRTMERMMESARHPHEDGTVCQREDNWEYLADGACGNGQMYAMMRGESYFVLWRDGLAICNGKPDPDYAQQREVSPLPPSFLAIGLAVCHEYAPLEDGAPPRRPVILHIEDQHLPSE